MSTAAYLPTRPSYLKLVAPYQKHQKPVNPVPSRDSVLPQMPINGSGMPVPNLVVMRALTKPKYTISEHFRAVAVINGEDYEGTKYGTLEQALEEHRIHHEKMMSGGGLPRGIVWRIDSWIARELVRR